MASKEKKALGSGLSVLFGEDDFNDKENENITVLPISKVEPRLEQPRNYFSEEALQTLAESIDRHGIIQPITVRQLENGRYQIIAGERRWRASRLAGLLEIPVRIIEADDRTTAELALVENLQREDLNPIEEAKGYQSLIEEYGLTQEETARSVGKSRPAITNAMRLLNLSPDVIALVERGDLSAGHARALIPITNAASQLKAANEIITKSYSVRKSESLAAKIVKEASKPPEEKATNEIQIDYAKEVSDELSRILGRKVNLIEGRKGGKIELEYYSPDDRENLISVLREIK